MPSNTGNVGGISTDGKAIFVSVADLGTYAIDLQGNVLWRVGARGGGEPAAPVVFRDTVVYSLAGDGMFIANRRTSELRFNSARLAAGRFTSKRTRLPSRWN